MRSLLFLLTFFCVSSLFSQNDALAKNYFEQGKYAKALSIYKKLWKQQPGRTDYTLYLIKTHQQLEQFSEAEAIIHHKLEYKRLASRFLVELGYNYALQDKDSLATINYRKAIDNVKENEADAFIVGKVFNEYSLLDEAVATYELAMELNPDRNYNAQLAKIYGEQGDLEKMFTKYIDLIESNLAYRSAAQRNFNAYVNEDPNNKGNQILRKTLLKKLQERPEILYNELLSWLFIQQKDFKKAFIQEKAIYKRSDQDLRGIIDLLRIAIDEESYDQAKEIVEFLIEKAPTPESRLKAHQYLININLKLADPKDYDNIEEQYNNLFSEFGDGPETIFLQIDYNDFLAFKHGKKEQAIPNLKKLAKRRMSAYQEARVKLKLADILVFDEKFNQALIYYSQVQKKVKSDVLAQEARFKVAQTSYFKGDFEWSLIQLDVLKKSASQLIANDAMELFLMIKDNSLEDSTQTALKKFARADLLILQNKNNEAVTLLDDILINHKGEKIEDEALLKQGMIYEKTKQFIRAEENYQKIIDLHKEDILADDAFYRLAQLYENELAQPEKAKELYEQIIFDFADSIYFVEARKRYRMLRGDEIN